MANGRFLILSAVLVAEVFASNAAAQGQPPPQSTPKTTTASAMPRMSGMQQSDTVEMTEMADRAMMGGGVDGNMMKHMALTPLRAPTSADSARARQVIDDLKRSIAKYKDTTAAVADGYKMFAPNVKTQKVFHFTSSGRGFKEAFRFNPEQPTSLLYQRDASGKLQLIGAMYTMPKNAKLDRLNERVPLSIARWHRHVNWCLPKLRESDRLNERDAGGSPKFGPESPVATRAACDEVGGRFYAAPLGWMVHVNVFAGDDFATIFGDHDEAEHKHGG